MYGKKIIRIMRMHKKDIMKFAGAWNHLSDKEIKEMKNTISKLRKKSTIELFNRIKELRKH